MSERDAYELGVSCWVAAAPADPGGAASPVSQLVIASQGA
jgi:hypothetical protein